MAEYLDVNSALLQAFAVKFPGHERAGEIAPRLQV